MGVMVNGIAEMIDNFINPNPTLNPYIQCGYQTKRENIEDCDVRI